MNEGQRRRTFYGWWVVLASSVIIFLGTGILFYSFGVFIKPLQEQFGWSRTAISGAVAVWAVMYGFAGPAVGVLLHKYGAKPVIIGSALLAGTSYLLFGWLQELPQLFGLMFFAGIGAAGVTLVPNQTLISNWFDKYRGRAMGIMMASIGLGGLTMPPFANALIVWFDWRTAFRVLGLVLLTVIIPAALLVIRTKPSDLGLEPDGIAPEAEDETASNAVRNVGGSGLPLKRALNTSSFWLLFAAFVFLIFGESGLTVHFVAFLDDEGLSSQTAANFWGLAVGISAAGRLLFGFLADRRNPRNLIMLTHGLHAVAVAAILTLFLYLGITPMGSILPFSVIYGLSLGGSAVLLPVLVARCFGLLNFSKLLGLLMSGFALGVVGGPLVAGRVFDATGSYQNALLIFLVGFVFAALAVSFVRPDDYRDEFVRS